MAYETEPMSVPEKTGQKQEGGRFQQGRSGNPAGRPRGSRNKASLAAEALLEGEAEAIVRKVLDCALAGDRTAMRLAFGWLLPPRRERSAQFSLPPLNSAADAPSAMAALLAAVADGQITAGEGAELAKIVEAFLRGLDAAREAKRREASDRLFPALNFG
jgi:hypothetical protein